MQYTESYNRVEAEQWVPKLGLDSKHPVEKMVLRLPESYLQEFQYGKETVQTTTTINPYKLLTVKRNRNTFLLAMVT